jgi:thiosulfate/3-mercaptopyruvate sulfurtransferase
MDGADVSTLHSNVDHWSVVIRMFSVKLPVAAILAGVWVSAVVGGCSNSPAAPSPTPHSPADSVSAGPSGESMTASPSESTPDTASSATPAEPVEPFVIDVARAKALLAEGALAVDGRGSGFAKAHLPGATPLGWEETSLPKSGRLRSPSDNGALFAARGIDPRKTLIVYGGKDTWGAEGRVFWMLEFYGAGSVKFLNGGIEAWVAAGHATEKGDAAPVSAAMQAEIAAQWASLNSGAGRALLAEVVHHVEQKDWQYADARSKAEFGGKVLYGEPRGGRIPGACWIEYLAVQESDGRLKSPDTIRAMATAAGLTSDKPVVTYCSGGVRSGLLYVALRYAGYDAKNYPGSMWEYTADASLPVEKD